MAGARAAEVVQPTTAVVVESSWLRMPTRSGAMAVEDPLALGFARRIARGHAPPAVSAQPYQAKTANVSRRTAIA
ncbi:MAG: hypothetical protein KDA22_16400, partial [Phycisphaerales bacterium]|nr:hypothetical protein [Phycisphaerales bacterium]